MLPPFTGPVGNAQAHISAEKVEVSKVQLLVSEHKFGQVVMRVYNGNLGGSRIIPQTGFRSVVRRAVCLCQYLG